MPLKARLAQLALFPGQARTLSAAVRRPDLAPTARAGRVAVRPVRGHTMTGDRLALATRTRKARCASVCTICHVPITIGQPITRLISPPGWCQPCAGPCKVAGGSG
jgi:hypothetical protein